MAWRENEFPAAPKKPESSDQLGGMSAMAQTVREIQDIQEIMNQVRSLKDELSALTDSVKDDMTGLKESVASLDDQARTYLKSREEIKRILKDIFIEYTIADDAIEKISKNFAKSLDDHLRKVGENHNGILKDINEVFLLTLQKTLNDAKGKVNEIEERAKNTTEGKFVISYTVLYWIALFIIGAVAMGTWGFAKTVGSSGDMWMVALWFGVAGASIIYYVGQTIYRYFRK